MVVYMPRFFFFCEKEKVILITQEISNILSRLRTPHSGKPVHATSLNVRQPRKVTSDFILLSPDWNLTSESSQQNIINKCFEPSSALQYAGESIPDEELAGAHVCRKRTRTPVAAGVQCRDP